MKSVKLIETQWTILNNSICVAHKNLVLYILSASIQCKPGERAIPAALWLAQGPAIINRDMSLSSQSQAAISLSFPVKMVSDFRYPKNRTFFKCVSEKDPWEIANASAQVCLSACQCEIWWSDSAGPITRWTGSFWTPPKQTHSNHLDSGQLCLQLSHTENTGTNWKRTDALTEVPEVLGLFDRNFHTCTELFCFLAVCTSGEKKSVADVWSENSGRWQKFFFFKKNPQIPRCTKSNRVTSQALPFLQSGLQGGLAAGMYFTLTHTDSIWSSGPLNHLWEEMFNSLTLCLCVTHVNVCVCARLLLPPDYHDVALQEWKWAILLCT